MSDNPPSAQDFISQVHEVINQNLANEHFGVSELADAMNMSRSNLLRKVQRETKLSVSQLINQFRLQRAMQMFRQSSMNVSEVSHQVGFNSTSYFIKCFREYYGYPPGEVGKRPYTEPIQPVDSGQHGMYWLYGALGVVLIAVATLYALGLWPFGPDRGPEKSIAVLPFKNESNDSTNVYLINGLMESTLGNLQKIKDLRVISRTSTEKYRTARKSIPEMAKELDVSYFVEGSGQKIGDQILLHVQLIDGKTDRHLWSNQYKREVKDIFQLQQEIARSIADEISVVITPEEAKRISKKPTENLAAYDLFMKGTDFQSNGEQQKAVEYFKKAIAQDPEFALAYAEVAIADYSMDAFQTEKRHAEEITQYSDKAILFDPRLGESLVAKALDYLSKKQIAEAEPYLEKALEYNPNSTDVLGLLTDYYALFNLNTGKYLQYALKGNRLNMAALDSATASLTCLRLGNALIQTGFVDESLKYIDKSLEYNPKNPFSRYLRAFVLYAKNHDAKQTRDLLLIEYNKDTTRFDILQDIAKISYFMRDYKTSCQYYRRFLAFRESRHMDIYRHENMIIAYVLAHEGYKEKSEALIEDYKVFLDADRSIYRTLGYATYYLYKDDRQKAIENLKEFSQEDNVQYWIILFLEDDPMIEKIKDDPDFIKYFSESKSRFWKTHDVLKNKLEEEGLL